ncbi:hypothetical protein ABIA19_003974 [Sinorhizobium fredii]
MGKEGRIPWHATAPTGRPAGTRLCLTRRRCRARRGACKCGRVVQGRVRPVRSRDEQNVDPDEALPNDEEEQSISDNLSREEVRFGEVKTPKPD